MVKLSRSFSSIQPFTALVIGDFMLDTYTTGRVKRISPEAPVPVMEVHKQESRPGGAGNAVLNLATLGAKVKAVGRIGEDAEGCELKKRLSVNGADISGLLVEANYKTPVKNRLIADSQQLLRVDFETVIPLSSSLEQEIVAHLATAIPTVQVVAISDYGKGFLTPPLLTAAIRIAKEANVPLIIDPKGIDFSKYRGATLLKPNLSEAYAAAKLPLSAPLDEVARVLLQITSVELLLITRSEAGISLFDKHGMRSDFPVRSREVKDVTGAGDTVLATVSLALANGLDMTVAAQLANIAAGIAIERLGCVQVTLSEIARRLLEYDAETKIYDENHTYALRQVLQGRRYILLILDQGQKMTNGLFRAIRQLSQQGDAELLVYVRGSDPSDEFIHLLASLQEVDFIIYQSENIKQFCQTIHPHEVFALENEKLQCLGKGKEILATLLDAQSETERVS